MTIVHVLVVAIVHFLVVAIVHVLVVANLDCANVKGLMITEMDSPSSGADAQYVLCITTCGEDARRKEGMTNEEAPTAVTMILPAPVPIPISIPILPDQD